MKIIIGRRAIHIGILATHKNEEIQRLEDAAKAAGHEVKTLDVKEFGVHISLCKPEIRYGGKSVEGEFDAIIPRIDIPYTSIGFKILRQFQAAGVYVVDTAYSLELARNKLRCLQYLQKQEVQFPATGFSYASKGYDSIIRLMGQPPFVIKLNEGTQGTGVFLADDEKTARNLLKTFAQLDTEVMLQEFIQESQGEDLRCFVVGGKVVAAMRRKSQDGDFRANISLGGHAYDVDLTDEERDISIKAAEAIKLNVAGVDVIRSERGPLVIEINGAPDFTGEYGLEKISGVDVAGEIIKYAEEGKARYDRGEGVWLEPDTDLTPQLVNKA